MFTAVHIEIIKKPAIAIALSSALVACDTSGQSTDINDETIFGNATSDILNDTRNELIEGPRLDQSNNNQETQNNQGNRRNARSPQGIPDGGNNRRENARGGREVDETSQPVLIDNREIRSYDGTGNNTNNVQWGSTFSHLQRLGQANYSDGIASMIFTDRDGPREISNAILTQEAGEQILNPHGTSDFSWQWGQFIDHDIDLTDGSADEPQNIAVPTGDRYFDPNGTGTVVIPFNRALYSPDTGFSSSNPREQENEITSWIDGSMVYGSSEERATALRVGPNSPFMKTSPGNLLPFNVDQLTNANGPTANAASLFLAGDVRVNEQVGLTAMHTLFVREHNRLARLLADADPNASAENIFQAARRLVVAEIQIITYEEHLPALIGRNAIPPYSGYDSTVNPTIYNEFSAGAYRLGHSMVSEQLLRLNADGTSIAEGPLSLEQAFFNAPSLINSENDIDPILRGLASQTHQLIDVRVIHPLRNLLFGRPGAGGLDLTALNIQRGRDHGLPSYADMRIAMGLTPVTSFADITNDNRLQQSLQDAYGDVSKVDLWVGGLAETPLENPGAQLGELFHAIIVKQFTELRDGDRFWYENQLSDAELALIEDVSLATVIRNNTDIGNELQDDVFYVN